MVSSILSGTLVKISTRPWSSWKQKKYLLIAQCSLPGPKLLLIGDHNLLRFLSFLKKVYFFYQFNFKYAIFNPLKHTWVSHSRPVCHKTYTSAREKEEMLPTYARDIEAKSFTQF